MKPITPDEARQQKLTRIPDEVIISVNELIVEKLTSSNYASFTQDELINRIISKSKLSRDEIFNKHYLDFEPIYQKAGWKVEYDKPAYNETYNATFKFTRMQSVGTGYFDH